MGFLRQKYWSGLTFPPPGDIPNPGIQTHVSCITGRFFTIWATREAHSVLYISLTFIFLDSKITADGDCSHEIKRLVLLGRKAMTRLDSILKSRDITLPTNICLVKAMVFPVVMYGCESGLSRKLNTEGLILLNCGVGEDTWESVGLQGDPTSPFWRRSTLGFLWKEWC